MEVFRELTRTYTAAQSQIVLGTKRVIAGKAYRYVQVSASSANACANGTVMLNTGSWVVSDDISANKQNDVIGIGIAAIAKELFGWIQVHGDHSEIATDGGTDITDGMAIFCKASTGATYDGTCDGQTVGQAVTYKPIGYTTADDDDTADTVAAFITLG